MRVLKGVTALHEETNAASASDAVAAALAVIRDEEPGFPTGGANDVEAAIQLQEDIMANTLAEQSKPVDQEPAGAPSLYVPGMEAIREAGAATEAERVREYGLLAEIEAKIEKTGEELEQIVAVIDTTTEVLNRAERDKQTKFDENQELEKQRAETVDRIVKLNQAAIDHETARLRRG